MTDLHSKMTTHLKNKSPVEIFEELFDENLLSYIVTQSLLYARQNNRHNFELSTNCLRKFIGIFLLSGYHSLPQEQMYWCEDEDIDLSSVRNCMPKNRFLDIKRNLHFNDNGSIIAMEKKDKLFKIRPIIDRVNLNFKKFGIFAQKLSVDEQMVRYYGHHYLKQWAMCSSQSGYCFQMDIYEGKSDEEKLMVTPTISFSSSDFIRRPPPRGPTVGTARYNRMNKCPLKPDKVMKKEERGAFDYFYDEANSIFALTWNDNSCVKLMSNYLGLQPLEKVKRYSKKEKKECRIDRPNIVGQYNKYMGGVDKLDWNVQKYRIKFRGKKWYFPLFTNAIDVAVVNAHALYVASNESIPLLDFQRKIARTYLKKESLSNPKTAGRPSSSVIRRSRIPSDVRFDPVGHLLERTCEGKQRKCALCSTNVRKQCRKCNVGLHVDCFPLWHNT